MKKPAPREICDVCGHVNAPEGSSLWDKVLTRCETCRNMEREHPAVFMWVQAVIRNAIEEHMDREYHEQRHRADED